MKKNFLILIPILNFFSNLINFSKSQICPQFNCTINQIDKCYKEINPLLFDIQDCNNGEKCSTDSGKCHSRKYDTYKQFNGGPCNEKNDCNFGDCDNSLICVKPDTKCHKNTECEIGYYCDIANSNCIKLKSLNQTCVQDEDCEYNLGCDLFGEKKCVEYFSLEEGKIVSNSTIFENKNYLCQSGFALGGKCLNGELQKNEKKEKKEKNYFFNNNKENSELDVDCSENNICSYKGNDNNIYNSTEKCRCNYNNNGGKICDMSYNDPRRNLVLNQIKILINQDIKSCHTTERFKLCVASSFDKKINGEIKTSNRFEYDKMNRNMLNTFTLNSDDFKNNTENYCAFSVIGDYNNYLVPPNSVDSCPVYKCSNSIKNCFESFNPNNNNSSGITISLNKDICNKTQYCDYDISKTKILENYSGKCSPKGKKQPIALNRYPGEECSDDTDCLNGLCLNGACFFKKFGEICDRENPSGIHGCGLNLFCAEKKNSSDFSKCENLKEFGAECSNTAECEMDTICYDGVCSKEYFSFADGKFINTNFIKDDYIKENVGYLCESSFFFNEKSRCAEYKIINSTDSNGYVECDISTKNSCVYEIISDFSLDNEKENENNIIKRNCECGFNTEGKGYCPIDNNHCKGICLFAF